MNEIGEMGGMVGGLLAIFLIVVGIPVFFGLLFKLFISFWGL